MSLSNALSPFLAFVNPETLQIQPNTGGYKKYFRELSGIYADEVAFDRLAESLGSAVAYRVDEARFSDRSSNLITGISVLEPGKVGQEFFMTRGHLHQRADRPETYYCLAGHGILLLESLAGEVEAMEMRPGNLVYVPPFWLHRSVNVGAAVFATLFSYPADAGQDFEIVRQAHGFSQLVVSGENGSWKLIPNSRYRPRTGQEVEAYEARTRS
ncbi:MAG: glucose-6-phosphate isomerase [Verrucomicrobia bacterium]|nr:glucose-6-phosphate isomerase [Verrucomicrobiota bacterium]MBV8274226.1 glucose-6-phosphate isomerase [Verrucomicrobiota bacterium]